MGLEEAIRKLRGVDYLSEKDRLVLKRLKALGLPEGKILKLIEEHLRAYPREYRKFVSLLPLIKEVREEVRLDVKSIRDEELRKILEELS